MNSSIQRIRSHGLFLVFAAHPFFSAVSFILMKNPYENLVRTKTPQTVLLLDWKDDQEYDDDDSDPTPLQPYRNRSMAWTLRYRKLNPYEKARARVISFGHRSKSDWDEAVASGQLGQYVPNYPDEMYAPEWTSWEEWLGLMRSYKDTQHVATSVLRLKSLDDYLLFVKSNSKRAEGLRIPLRPDLYYKDEWIDETTFFQS